jgi:hypothetical protein
MLTGQVFLLVQSIQIEDANLPEKITGLHAGQNFSRFAACPRNTVTITLNI